MLCIHHYSAKTNGRVSISFTQSPLNFLASFWFTWWTFEVCFEISFNLLRFVGLNILTRYVLLGKSLHFTTFTLAEKKSTLPCVIVISEPRMCSDEEKTKALVRQEEFIASKCWTKLSDESRRGNCLRITGTTSKARPWNGRFEETVYMEVYSM